MDLSAIIRRVIEIGEQRGFVTFDEINELVPSSVEPEMIEALLEAMSESRNRRQGFLRSPTWFLDLGMC